MEGELKVVEKITEAVSILNKLDKYFESLDNMLSECDSLRSDYEHIIENTDLKKLDIEKLLSDMQEVLNKRRTIKNDILIRNNFDKLRGRLNNQSNREFLIQGIKTTTSKIGKKYSHRILTREYVDSLLVSNKVKPKRGRPKKAVE